MLKPIRGKPKILDELKAWILDTPCDFKFFRFTRAQKEKPLKIF